MCRKLPESPRSPFPKAVPEPARPVDPPPDPFEFLGNRVVEEERHGPPMGHHTGHSAR